MPETRASDIVRAAEALEEEVARLEGISWSTRRIKLTSEKNLARATAELKETLAVPERLGQRLQAVATAMARMQERQNAALEPLTALAVEIRRRTELLGTHMRTFGALGEAAAAVNAELEAGQGERAVLAQAEARLGEISAAARALFEAARAADFPEIAREADVLKQRMTALGKRLGRSG